DSRFAVTTKIRNNQPIARFKRGNKWLPKVSIGGKWMQQDERRPTSTDLIEDLRAGALDRIHGHASSIAARPLGMRHLLGSDRRLHQLWFARHHDPRDDV